MATIRQTALGQIGSHSVAYNASAIECGQFDYGAIAKEDLENGALVTLEVVTVDGEPTWQCKYVTDATKGGAYIAINPADQSLNDEPPQNYYIKAGEAVTLYNITQDLTIVTNLTAFNTGISAFKIGQFAHFDPTTKKFMISETGKVNAGYAGAKLKFSVVDVDDDTFSQYGVETIVLKLITE